VVQVTSAKLRPTNSGCTCRCTVRAVLYSLRHSDHIGPSMSRWLKEVAALFAAIVTRCATSSLDSLVIQSDATICRSSKEDLEKRTEGFIWVYRGDADHPYVFYDYSEYRAFALPGEDPQGLQGNSSNRRDQQIQRHHCHGATSANCWAHVHCYFEEAWRSMLLSRNFQWE